MKFNSPVKSIELKNNGKLWVEVEFENDIVWTPRLWEVGAIISGIGRAEDIKYPNGKGHKLTKEFFDQCWGKTREQIYELSLSSEFDPNGIMASRYRDRKCITCGEWFDGEGIICNSCTDTTKESQ